MNLQAEIRPELWNAVSQQYEADNYTNALLAALHYLRDVLRETANVDGDGVALAGQALGGNPPRLRLSKLETESQKDEQKGFEQLLRGLYQGIRNPRTHDLFQDKKEVADAIIVFVNYILGVISKAKGPFNIEEWTGRVFDPDFVASERYALLLASDVPPKKHNEALISIYKNKVSGDGGKLRVIFHTLTNMAGNDNVGELLATVSEELRKETDDKNIRYALQILPPRLWPRIDEAARLRIENKLIRSIEAGTANSVTRRSINGGLGTWARDFANYFTLRNELYDVLLRKLRKDAEEQAYVALFFWSVLPYTFEQPINEFSKAKWIEAICHAVTDPYGSSLVKEKLSDSFQRFSEDWRNTILEKLKHLETEDTDFYSSLVGTDEIPF